MSFGAQGEMVSVSVLGYHWVSESRKRWEIALLDCLKLEPIFFQVVHAGMFCGRNYANTRKRRDGSKWPCRCQACHFILDNRLSCDRLPINHDCVALKLQHSTAWDSDHFVIAVSACPTICTVTAWANSLQRLNSPTTSPLRLDSGLLCNSAENG